MDAKQACDKLNGFNFQNRYLVGEETLLSLIGLLDTKLSSYENQLMLTFLT